MVRQESKSRRAVRAQDIRRARERGRAPKSKAQISSQEQLPRMSPKLAGSGCCPLVRCARTEGQPRATTNDEE